MAASGHSLVIVQLCRCSYSEQPYSEQQNKSLTWKMPQNSIQWQKANLWKFTSKRSVSVHVRNWQIHLATKVFKVHSDFSPPIFKELFHNRTLNYELWHPSQLRIPRIESVYNGSESITYLGPKIWNMVPSELQEMLSISSFKKAIKEWHPSNCPCRLCKRYLGNIGLFKLIIYMGSYSDTDQYGAFSWLFLRETPSWLSGWISEYAHVICLYL